MSTTEFNQTLPSQSYSSMKDRFAAQWYSLPRWARITLVIGVVWAVWKWMNPWELVYLFLLIVGIGGSLVFGVFYVLFEFFGCGEDAVKLFSKFMEDIKQKVAENAEQAAQTAVHAVSAEQVQEPTPEPTPPPKVEPQPDPPAESNDEEG